MVAPVCGMKSKNIKHSWHCAHHHGFEMDDVPEWEIWPKTCDDHQRTGTGHSAATLSPKRGKDRHGDVLFLGKELIVQCWGSVFTHWFEGLISEKINKKLRAHIEREIEPKWWVELILALTCRVYQEQGITEIDCNFVTFSEAWHCVNYWRKKYWLIPVVTILKY